MRRGFVGGTVELVGDLVSHQTQEVDILRNPVLKILPADVKDRCLGQCFNGYGGFRHARQNRHLAHKVNGLILLNHEHIAVLEFIDHPVLTPGNDSKIFQLVILLMDDNAWRVGFDPVALFQLLWHIF